MLPLLSLLLFLPALGAVLIAMLGVARASAFAIRLVATIVSGVVLILSAVVFFSYDVNRGGLQFVERAAWLRIPTSPSFNVDYFVGVDGLSTPLVLLTGFLTFLAVLISWSSITSRVTEYFALLLVLQTGVFGVFMSLDFFLFFIFWEVELLPMYLLIGIWGSGRRMYAAMKFLIYTLFGSAFMLVGMLLIYFTSSRQTFDMFVLADEIRLFPFALQSTIFFLLFIAYAIKLPVFPLHTWLPDAHGDAPTAVSVLLAGVLLKMGAYALFRINVGMFPLVAQTYAPLLVALAVVGILYGAVVTIMQTDLKRLVAYSSVSHMGYVLLGVAAGVMGASVGQASATVAFTGAALQMFTHGAITGLLFASIGVLYERAHTREIAAFSGLAQRMPTLATVFLIGSLASLGLPGMAGFVSELLVFLGSYPATPVFTTFGAFGVVLAAGYLLFLYRRVFFGPLNARWSHLT
ncbi:MAG: NADH-quinone oxidoreductase subunit M, partial [Dehalococcoidia bacterium]|nr:NADH-quinone oxidoreductase subunit M [Dehalococcoidia bacterium]